MTTITSPSIELSSYRDQHFKGSRGEQERLLRVSTTLYVGNLSFYTTEEQIYELFSKCGDIKRIIMGLDKYKKTPCGFCFAEYYTRTDAENCMRYVNGTRLDDRIVRTDWDAGFIEGRQYGRGKTGGQGSRGEQERLLRVSTTLYVGNLSFYTTEEQIYELFSKCGDIKRIIMGLDKYKKTPCGFCFAEYYTRTDAENCMRYVNGTRLDDRIVRTDWDAGFIEGRQYGRGKTGGQVRDEYRTDFDNGRGGYGKIIQQKVSVPEVNIFT